MPGANRVNCNVIVFMSVHVGESDNIIILHNTCSRDFLSRWNDICSILPKRIFWHGLVDIIDWMNNMPSGWTR